MITETRLDALTAGIYLLANLREVVDENITAVPCVLTDDGPKLDFKETPVVAQNRSTTRQEPRYRCSTGNEMTRPGIAPIESPSGPAVSYRGIEQAIQFAHRFHGVTC